MRSGCGYGDGVFPGTASGGVSLESWSDGVSLGFSNGGVSPVIWIGDDGPDGPCCSGPRFRGGNGGGRRFLAVYALVI